MEKRGSVAVLTWHSGPQNQFTSPFLQANLDALAECEQDKAVRAVVVTASHEKYFSTGIHLAWMMEQGAQDVELVHDFLKLLNRILITWTGYPKPLVCAINGHAVGGGAILPCCADYRLMNADAGFVRFPEVQINIPFWPGMSAIVKDILTPQSIRTMFYTGDKFTSQQSLEMGYIDEVHPSGQLVDMAVELAKKLGQAENSTYKLIKDGIRGGVLKTMEEEDPKTIGRIITEMKGQS